MREMDAKMRAIPMSRKVAALISAGALAASCMGAPLAFASDVTPLAGAQTGTGTTDVTVQLKTASDELGGAGSEGNPDSNNDGYGDNIAFSVPMSINFVSDSNGHLTGPSNAAIQNHSKFPIHGSSLQVTAASGWNIVSDAAASDQANAVDFQIGPATDMLDASHFLTKGYVTTPSAWNMPADNGSVALQTAGDVNNLEYDISVRTRIATLRWYVTPGLMS